MPGFTLTRSNDMRPVFSLMPYTSAIGTPIVRYQRMSSAGMGAAPVIAISHWSSPISSRTVEKATASRNS